MRIVLPAFDRPHKDNLKFAYLPWRKTTVLQATLASIKKSFPSKILVASNNQAILADAEHAKVETLEIKRLAQPDETFLPLGTMSTLKKIGPSPKESTLILWPGAPWFDSYCYNFFKEFKFSSQKKMATTVRRSRAHPAQMYEGLNLMGASPFFPLALSDDRQFYRTETFPFDWVLRTDIDNDGRFFMRHAEGEKVFYDKISDDPSGWNTDVVLERITSETARFTSPKIENMRAFRSSEDNAPLIPFSYAPPWAGESLSQILFLQQPDTNKLYLAVDFNNLPSTKKLSVKIWLKDKNQLHPWLQNGIPLQKNKGVKFLDDRHRKGVEAFELPDLPFLPTLFLVWLVSYPGSPGGDVSFQLPWLPNDDAWKINGRQDFPPIYEPDGLGTLLAAGFHPTTEPLLQDAAVEHIFCDELLPLPVRDIVEALRAEYQSTRLLRQ